MGRRIIRIVSFALVTVILVVLLGGGFLLWQIRSGPVSLSFMTAQIENEINRSLIGMNAKIGTVVLEHDSSHNIPRLRLVDVELRDTKGGLIARAPRAAIDLDASALLSFTAKPTALDLIGPHILVKRTRDGAMKLGFGAVNADGTPVASEALSGIATESDAAGKGDQPDSATGKSDIPGTFPTLPDGTPAEKLLAVLSEAAKTGGVGGMTRITIKDANVSLYDEANLVIWNAPDADIAFQRMPYGLALVGHATVQSGGGPVTVDVTANYRAGEKQFVLNVRAGNIVPAVLAEKIPALAALANVALRFDAEAEIALSGTGTLTSARAMVTADKGKILVPQLLPDPLVVRHVEAHMDYDPVTGIITISDALVSAGLIDSTLAGRITPRRNADGSIASLAIQAALRNVTMRPRMAGLRVEILNRVDLDGVASGDGTRFTVNDFFMSAGNSAVRMRGEISRGAESPGMVFVGRASAIPVGLLRTIWMPKVSPRNRQWADENVKAGMIDSADFTLNIAPDAMARAEVTQVINDDAVNMQARISGLSTRYFQDMPTVEGLNATLAVRGNDMLFSFAGGTVKLESGKSLTVTQGSMKATHTMATVVPAHFEISALASLPAAIEYFSHRPLTFMKAVPLGALKFSGQTALNISLDVPMQPSVVEADIKYGATGKVSNFAVSGISKSVDVTGGAFDFKVGREGVTAQGQVIINDQKADMAWNRPAKAVGLGAITLSIPLSTRDRSSLFPSLNPFLEGPVLVSTVISDPATLKSGLDVSVDLSEATIRLNALRYVRGPVKSKATFTYKPASADQPPVISDINVSGGGFALRGDVVLTAKGTGLASASLPTVTLGANNSFAMSLKRVAAGYSIKVDAPAFDAQPLIASLMARTPAGAQTNILRQPPSTPGETLLIDATVGKVQAARGEVIVGLKANLVTKGSDVQKATITGNFLSGQPINISLAGDGGRTKTLEVTGRDAGAALRAANLYSKVAGGKLTFNATLLSATSSLAAGDLEIENFAIRNEAAFAELDKKGKPLKAGPRKDSGISFKRLTVPITADAGFYRLKNASMKGAELCAFADGVLRKADMAIEITGTVLPACAANRLLDDVPIINILIPEGLLGVTFAITGTLQNPAFHANPASVLAPGILRELFSYQRSSPRRATFPTARE